ncbi:unannotated protein [freshwater metagenome]|uniref:Unannotated protein n=1 Tax=freshwater metagenome TaxID=449393 RepID=A0A6J6SQ73_9ZZZZ
MKGALGWRWLGFWTTDRTVNSRPVSADWSPRARVSSKSTAFFAVRVPDWSKSLPRTTRCPSTAVSRASKASGSKTPSISQ